MNSNEIYLDKSYNLSAKQFLGVITSVLLKNDIERISIYDINWIKQILLKSSYKINTHLTINCNYKIINRVVKRYYDLYELKDRIVTFTITSNEYLTKEDYISNLELLLLSGISVEIRSFIEETIEEMLVLLNQKQLVVNR